MSTSSAPTTPVSPSLNIAPDPQLQQDLYRAHVAARSMLGCDHLAADAVQEALIALWQQPAPPPHRRAWLVQAVVFRARAMRRAYRRRQRHEDHAAHHHCAEHHDCNNPLHHAFAHEFGERLAAAVQLLPREQREPFELLQHGELDYASIAQRLAVPIGTVRSRLHRARRALHSALGDDPTAGAAVTD